MNRVHFRLALIAVVGTLAAISGKDARAAIESRNTLKTYFETGDVPTQEQFVDVLDSFIHLTEDRNLLGLRTTPGGTAEKLAVGDVLDSSIVFGPADGLGSEWLSQSGFLGLSFEQDSQVHYGYLHVTTDVDNVGTMYPMTIDLFVFENVPGAPVTVAALPEPSALGLAALGSLGLAAWAWRRTRAARG